MALMRQWMRQNMLSLYLKNIIMQNFMLCIIIRADVDLFGPHETSEFMTTMRNEGEKYLNKVRLKANEKNIQIKTEIISSTNIAGGIVDYAEENKIDLIVIGTRGRTGFKKLLLGSVASHVVTYAHCP